MDPGLSLSLKVSITFAHEFSFSYQSISTTNQAFQELELLQQDLLQPTCYIRVPPVHMVEAET